MPKKINWVEIKKRYLKNDTPAEIAADHNITSKQVRDKAYREKWSTEKATLLDEISTQIATEIKTEVKAEVKHQLLSHFDLLGEMGQILGQQLRNIKAETTNMGAIKKQDESKANEFHLETHKQSTKFYYEFQKLAAKNQPDGGEKPGINIIAPDGQG